MRRRAAAAAALAAVALAGCQSDPDSVAGQARGGGDANYISQSGGIEHLAPGNRKEPVVLSGTTLDGDRWSVADAKGKVVVLNVWGSWCPPCTKEQPDLNAAHARLTEQRLPVEFMGVDIRENPETARAFVRANEVPYPSLADDGTTVAALQGSVSSPPVTLVLDRQGRIAGRIIGATTTATLVGLVQDVVKDGA